MTSTQPALVKPRPAFLQVSRRGEVIRAAAATVLLIGLLAGIPLLLIWLGHGPPLRTGIPITELRQELASRDDGQLLLEVLLAAGWVGWAGFTTGTACEIFAVTRGRVAYQVPFGAIQRLAGQLVTTVLLFVPATHTPLMLSSPALTLSATTTNTATPRLTSAEQVSIRTTDTAVMDTGHALPLSDTGPDRGTVSVPKFYVVADPQDGNRDTLWGIAARYLGDPLRWHDIYQLNKDRPQPDGSQMTDPALIRPGWRLIMPADTTDLPLPVKSRPVIPPTASSYKSKTTTHTGEAHIGQRTPTTRTTHPGAPAASPEPRGLPRISAAGRSQPSVHEAPDSPEPSTNRHHDPASSPLTGNQTEAAAAVFGALLATGVVTHLARLRRLQRRRRTDGHTIPTPPAELAGTEVQLRVAADPLPGQQLNIALRTLTESLNQASPSTGEAALADVPVRTAMLTSRDLRLRLDPPVPAAAPARLEGPDWVLTLEKLPQQPPDLPSLLPLLIPIGRQDTDLLLIDLERLGTLHLDGDPDILDELLAALITELATSSSTDNARVTVIGLDPSISPALTAVAETYPDRISITGRLTPRLLAALTATAEHVRAVTADGTDPVLRSRVCADSEPHNPELLILLGEHAADAHRTLRHLAGELPRPGFTIITTELASPADGASRLSVTRHDALLHPDDQRCVPFRLSSKHAADIRDLVEGTSHPAGQPSAVTGKPYREPQRPVTQAVIADTSATARVSPSGIADSREEVAAVAPAAEPKTASGNPDLDQSLDDDLAAYLSPIEAQVACVQILGPPDIRSAGRIGANRRSICLEIIVYLATHPRGADLASLEGAIWPTGVAANNRHQTLARARAWLGNDQEGKPHLPLILDGQLRLGPHVLTDWDLFTRLARRARRRPATSLQDLEAALTLVRGRPFENVPSWRYGWLADSLLEQHIPSAIVDATHDLATHYLEAGNADAARRTAEKALTIDPYDERPWRDLMLAAAAEDNKLGVIKLRDQLIRLLGDDAEDDLAPETLQLLTELLNTG